MGRKQRPDSRGYVYSTDPDFRRDEEIPAEETPDPRTQRLVIRLDTKQRAGKTVSLVQGFKGRMEDLEALGKLLKSHCGTGGSVKDGTIIIQGDQRGKIFQWLIRNQYVLTKQS